MEWCKNHSLYVHPFDGTQTEITSYLLNCVIPAEFSPPVIALISALGLTTGGGGTHPSFTWSISNTAQLIATPIGSAIANDDWFFWIELDGEISTT